MMGAAVIVGELFEDAVLLTRRRSTRPEDSECREDLEAGKDKGLYSPLKPLERTYLCRHPDFSPVRPILDF